MEGFPVDEGTASPGFEESFGFPELMNFDSCAELCSPSSYGEEFTAFGQANTRAGAGSSFTGYWQTRGGDAVQGAPSGYWFDVDKSVAGTASGQFSHALDSSGREVINSSSHSRSDPKHGSGLIPRSLNPSVSLTEKMLGTLQYLRDSTSSGALTQFWVPVKNGEDYVLSTCQQPYSLDQNLAGYREVSRNFTFSMNEGPGLRPGLPGRVFISGMSEWTSDVFYYQKEEYLRVDYARKYSVHGSIAVPVFDPADRSCRAVLELITMKEKPNFDEEMESICRALQAVNLKAVKVRAQGKRLTKSQMDVYTEIKDILRVVCHALMLPLALTWIPFFFDGESDNCHWRNSMQEILNSSKGYMLHVEESACYVNDVRMHDFLHACTEHILKEGRGIAGKTLRSNHPFFYPDVKCYDICEYPLVHHARKFGLCAAVAIRLRSTHTGSDDYILEFFLPVNCTGASEQQRLLGNLYDTMKKICRSLRTVSDAEIVRGNSIVINDFHGERVLFPSSNVTVGQTACLTEDLNTATIVSMKDQHLGCDSGRSKLPDKFISDSTRNSEKKRSITEKHVSLNILQQYFSGSLKDAAKGIGVCPTTLKRICRQHGISRWPSRKINKVNRSLKKIKTVIESVQGVEGAIRYDPVSGNLVAAVTPSENAASLSPDAASRDLMLPSSIKSDEHCPKVRKVGLDSCAVGETFAFNTDCEDNKTFPPAVTFGIPIEPGSTEGLLVTEDSDQYIPSTNRRPFDPDEFRMGNINAAENNNPSSSATTDSSNGSELSYPPVKNSTISVDSAGKCSPAITVKATYMDDTVRFKFSPSLGYFQLLEEVGNRFRLAAGTFQLKYMDDEDEWVMLTSDADMQECMEIMESIGRRNVKIFVREHPGFASSSVSSNFLS